MHIRGRSTPLRRPLASDPTRLPHPTCTSSAAAIAPLQDMSVLEERHEQLGGAAVGALTRAGCSAKTSSASAAAATVPTDAGATWATIQRINTQLIVDCDHRCVRRVVADYRCALAYVCHDYVCMPPATTASLADMFKYLRSRDLRSRPLSSVERFCPLRWRQPEREAVPPRPPPPPPRLAD